METPDPLSELADIHLPAAVDPWPPAFGWWLLAVLLVAALVTGGWRLQLLWVRRRQEAAALRELEAGLRRYRDRAAADSRRNRAGLEYLAELNAILRRVALFHYPEIYVAGLSGEAWLAFLDRADGGNAFRTGPGQALAEGVYRPSFEADAEALYHCARRWIQNRYREQPAARHRASEARA